MIKVHVLPVANRVPDQTAGAGFGFAESLVSLEVPPLSFQAELKAESSAIAPPNGVPLCVDLDGTLIKTDLVWESLVRLLRRNPLYIFSVIFWLLHGRARLKAEIARRVELDPVSLPYIPAVLDFVRGEKQNGRAVLLVTASDERLAQRVSSHLGIFTQVLASDGQINLRGKNKAARLTELFGEHGFDYAGDSYVDLPVWRQSRHAIVVSSNARLAASAAECATVERVFPSKTSGLSAFMRALRPHQWVKNLIIFVPLLTSHKITQAPMLLKGVLAFGAFSLCASAMYILNDLVDLDADRQHASKRSRPLAAGDLRLSAGLTAVPLLLAASAVIAGFLSWKFAAALGVYVVLTGSYSWRWKQIPLLDVFCLAGLYTVRLIAGHEAPGIVYSFWLLVFSMFIFLSLALVKRFVELTAARQQGKPELAGRGYATSDLELVATLGTSSGYMAALVLALYVNSQEVRSLYEHPTLLLLICPLLLYWISRVWLIAHRGQMHDDPIVFALKDRTSYAIGALTLAVLWLATGHR